MNQYISQEIIDRAYSLDKWMGGRVSTLSKFAVSGTIDNSDFYKLTHFLEQEGIAVDTNGTNLVWLGVLDKGLADLLKKTK